MRHDDTAGRRYRLMRRFCASAPHRRTGANSRIPVADIGMAAFAVFLLQAPSFLDAQATLRSRHGRSNVSAG